MAYQFLSNEYTLKRVSQNVTDYEFSEICVLTVKTPCHKMMVYKMALKGKIQLFINVLYCRLELNC